MNQKAGNRHSADDRERIKNARKHARDIDALMQELGDIDESEQPQDTTKQLSLTSQVMNVSRAVYEAAGMVDSVYVVEVFPDYAVVAMGGSGNELYRVNYTIDSMGSVTVDPRYNWQPGEQQFVPYPATESFTMHSGGTVHPVKGLVADKAAKDGMLAVAGYLVQFGTPEQTDLSGEYFTKDTDFGFAEQLETDVYFHHRMPLKTRDGDFITVKERIGRGILRKDERGIFIDAILYNREQYESALAALGWSSGTASHLVDYEITGKSRWIKAWPLGLDASLTPMPNEPRNAAWQTKAQTPTGQPQAVGETGMSGVDELRIVRIRRIDHA